MKYFKIGSWLRFKNIFDEKIAKIGVLFQNTALYAENIIPLCRVYINTTAFTYSCHLTRLRGRTGRANSCTTKLPSFTLST
jgi:hypothetical protein